MDKDNKNSPPFASSNENSCDKRLDKNMYESDSDNTLRLN